MTTLYDLLLARYENVARITKVADIPAADLAAIQTLASNPDIYLSNSTLNVEAMAAGTTQVAVLAYQFFTGATPTAAGLDYLVSPEGPNPNNLNSAYYQHFSIENRYINFAVNLGKLGEGQAAFNAGYGALSLADAVTKAYTEIFGHAPVAGKVDAILGAAVPDGLGGTYTRADYFAAYGLDGPNGLGTKAAAIGWLLEVSLQGEGGGRFSSPTYGPYATALSNYLADLVVDGQAQFHDNMLADYAANGPYLPGGALYQGSPGLTFTIGQFDTLNAPFGNYTGFIQQGYSTDGNDIINAPNGLASLEDAIYAGDGNDVITVHGVMAGAVFDGQGNDTINIDTLAGIVSIGFNQGYDTVNIGGVATLQLDSLGDVLTTKLPLVSVPQHGVDHVNFAAAFGPGAIVTADFSGATSIDAPLAYISARTAAGSNSVFEYGGSTYVYHQDATPGVDAGDSLVWLNNAVGLTVANGAAMADIHFG